MNQRRFPSTALIGAGLFLLPLAVYWRTVFHRFGFRDDYATLNETHFSPGIGFGFFAAQGRPFYGTMIAHTFGPAVGVDDLSFIRLLAVLVLGLVAAGTFLVLQTLDWDEITAAFVAALIAVLPGVQVAVSWAVCWPHIASLLLALVAFACAEFAQRGREGPPRLLPFAGAVLLVLASGLTYQAGAQFYVALVAAGLVQRRGQTWLALGSWLARHAGALGIGLATALTLTEVSFAQGWAESAARVAIEPHLFEKIGWFAMKPLETSLGLLALADPRSPHVHQISALGVALVIAAGAVAWGRRNGWSRGLRWGAAIVALLPASFGVCFLVAERWASYRTMVALAATLVVLIAAALRDLGGVRLARMMLGGLVVIGAWLAHRQTFELFARPQGLELALLESEAAKIDLGARPKVYAILAQPGDSAAPFVYGDEFGSISLDAEWAAKEMLRLVLIRRHPEVSDVTRSYSFAAGAAGPLEKKADVVIDLRRLRTFRVEP